MASQPDGLSPRGAELWVAMNKDRSPSVTESALIVEAARLVGRLDRMDAILRGDVDTWARLTENEQGEIAVVIDQVATEARLTAGALKAIVSELRQHGDESATGGVSALDELAARRSAGRGAGSPGS